MIFLPKHNFTFPDPRQYHPLQGLVATGGNLEPDTLLAAYGLGLFPWYNPGEEILWWSPDPRFVLFPQEAYVSKSMQKVLDRKEFAFTENQNFETVMRACAESPRADQDGTWISEELIQSFLELHRRGRAHSVEVWKQGQLVGGFYGLKVNSIFCGESMFSRVSNASRDGFVWFAKKNQSAFSLIDCQVYSSHLESLGAVLIPKQAFLDILHRPSVIS